ncbi:MobA/MobL family protein [Faucicola atlantae]|uniref:MobA/MobL protein domain-containing protein n=1 Tax=Faucicola atlantae TaxID=34059 RepID=A0A1B8QBU1_9GAMM|nr:MobA/MobL family protein [Moraxella atlantae]OBX78204.1 hypothetical protein A9306_09710 [Moraxella atlantae]
MAIGMMSVRVEREGKALPHCQYIAKLDKFAKDSDQVVAHSYGNMPDWAKDNPALFWEMADLHERKNGSTYREHILALPRELSQEQRLVLLGEWIEREIGTKYPYQVVVHNKPALDGGEQPHADLMFSERLNDGIARPFDRFFKRHNSKDPAKSGAKKDNTGLAPAERRTLLKAQRERWGELVNRHLLEHGFAPVVDMRNWKERGLDSKPVNYTMKQMNNTEFKEAYSEMVTTKRELLECKPLTEIEISTPAAFPPRNIYRGP